jgi:type II secretory pathway predicted ATPase ExeA
VYESHFGLSRRPFGETVDPAAYVALPSRESVVRRLRFGLEHGQGAALMFGPPGSGKTLVARVLAGAVAAPAAHLTFPAMPPADLFSLLATELGAESGATVGQTLQGLRRRLADASARGGRPLLVVDEAHLIDEPATFEALRALLNFASLGPPDLMLLLVAAPEVLLRLPAGLADRLTARCLLGPLSEDETHTYINGRLAAAGASATSPFFPREATAALHRAADGLPRRLNRLADLALLIAYAQGEASPDLRSVTIAVREADPDGLAA